ncbi:MAG: hypothetical protein ACM31C_33570 [Acidobacteriota bacterium]
MRSLVLVSVLAACGGSHSATNPDANSGGDGNGGTDSPGGGNPATITVTLVDHPTNAAMYSFVAAYQDGAAPWTAAPAPSGDTYSFTINSPVWAFAWTCIVPGTTIARVELAYFTVAEKTSLTETIPVGCTDRAMNVGVMGAVTNMPGGGGFGAWYATRGPVAVTRGTANGDGTFALEAPAGAHDLVVTEGTLTAGTLLVTDVGLARGVTAPTTTATVDWNNANQVVQGNVTFPQTTAGASTSTTLYSAGHTQVTLVAQSTGPFVTEGLDPADALTGDVYAVAMTVRGNGATASVESWTTTTADQTFAPPTPLGGATSSVPAAMPYPQILTTWNAYTGATGYVWDARQGGGNVGTTNTAWTAILGPGYLGGTPRFEMPDLSGLAGWKQAFQLASGQQVIGTTAAQVSSAGAGDFPPVNPAVAGTTRTTVSSGWTVTP